MTQELPAGVWQTPIDSEMVASSSIRYALPQICGDSVYWIEGRPKEGGRNVIVRKTGSGSAQDVLPDGYSAASKAHEYGGGAYVVHNQMLWFVNQKDQKVYRIDEQVVTPFFGRDRCRYADLDITENVLVLIEEELLDDQEPQSRLLGVTADSGQVLFDFSGPDFLSTPRISPDGRQVAWLQWQHPQMPWDGSQLWLADVTSSGLTNHRKIAGDSQTSVFQPEWSQDNRLYFSSDKTGWWSIYCFSDNNIKKVLSKTDCEFGLPQWVFGMRVFGFLSENRLIAACANNGSWILVSKDLLTDGLAVIDQPMDGIDHVVAGNNKAVFLGGNAKLSNQILMYTGDRLTTVTGAKPPSAELSSYLSHPRTIEFQTNDNESAYAHYYEPTNPNFDSPVKPPLLVKAHSGPTGAANRSLDFRIQYWTSRGYGVLDVDYRGSTGYGRAYRSKLDGGWGVVDVQDCLAATDYLTRRDLVDPNKMVITGSSAGGFTVLCALTFHKHFRAGASMYGVADPVALAEDTHKFESRYLDNLIAPYPERKDVYAERSPLHNHDSISSPTIFFQGTEDKVVPPSQSETMYRSLRNKGLPTCYLLYEGEGHGFRKAETQKSVIDSEFAFYTRLFGISHLTQLREIPMVNKP